MRPLRYKTALGLALTRAFERDLGIDIPDIPAWSKTTATWTGPRDRA